MRIERTGEWMVSGGDPAAAVYGLLAIGALMAAESGHHETHLDTFLSALVAALSYWLLHAYARMLGRRMIAGEHLRPSLLAEALGRERLLLAGAAVPTGVLLIAWAAGASRDAAVNDALWSAVIGVVLFELFAAMRARSSRRELALDVGIGLMLGLAILALRVLLH
ncbi:MAG TPA: hypothetical protein VKG82_02895 [Solirubrobacteraceae bacterium]|nr:hypothetical protein [Solirubrobacteraceae bacterium]